MKCIHKFSDILLLLGIFILAFWAVKPLLAPGFFPIHDDTQVARVYEMGKALKDGIFPVRIVSDLGYGYGYPLFNFYAPLAYYIGGFLLITGLTALTATKITMIFGILLSGISMYVLAKSFFGKIPATLSSLLYIYATYHAVDIYVRGDVAEYFAYAFIPLVFYGIWQAYKTESWRNIAIGALGFAGVILSHNLTAFMISPFVCAAASVLAIISYKKNSKKWFISFLPLLFGALIASFYWLPVFTEMKYANVLSQIGGGADYRQHFVCLSQFWYSPWGYGGSVPGCMDGLSFMIGKLHILFAGVGLVSIFFLWRTWRVQSLVLLTAGLGLVLSIFFATDVSKFIWGIMPGMAFLQYPWRFLELISFFASFLAGGMLFAFDYFLQKQNKNLGKYGVFMVAIFCIGYVIVVQQKFFVPQKYLSVTSESLTTVHAMFDASKTSDEYMPSMFIKPKTEKEYVVNPLEISSYRGRSTLLVNKTQSKVARVLILRLEPFVLPIAYFPEWHLYLDSREVNFFPTTRGLLVNFPIGYHTVVLQLRQTSIEIVSNMLSLAGILGLILGIIVSERKFSHDKTSS